MNKDIEKLIILDELKEVYIKGGIRGLQEYILYNPYLVSNINIKNINELIILIEKEL